jgi:hypothetical protein
MNPLVATLHAIHRRFSSLDIPPFRLSATADAVSRLAEGSIFFSPDDDRLEKLLLKIKVLLGSNAMELELLPREWPDAACLFFEIWNDRPLGEDLRFQRGILLAAKSNSKVAKRCIYIYLRDFDPLARQKSEPLRLVIKEILALNNEDLKHWSERNQKFHIFQSLYAPGVVVSELNKRFPSTLLTECLDHAGIIAGGFSFAMLLEWCQMAHTRPWEKLEMIHNWMRLCNVPEEGRVFLVIESLLEPWRNVDPDAIWRTTLLAWLQEHYGDPRESKKGPWAKVNKELRAVAIRWITLAVIEGFFEVLDDYALIRGDIAIRRQWPFRRAFWLAYYRRGVILDAKVAVGKDMEKHLGWEKLRSRFGKRTARLEAPDSQQSALFLKMRGLLVFVGTHNARCRVWDDATPSAPNFLMSTFRYSEILTNPRGDLQIDEANLDTGIPHVGSESGLWQRKMRDFIRNKIGVMVTDTEFMP